MSSSSFRESIRATFEARLGAGSQKLDIFRDIFSDLVTQAQQKCREQSTRNAGETPAEIIHLLVKIANSFAKTAQRNRGPNLADLWIFLMTQLLRLAGFAGNGETQRQLAQAVAELTSLVSKSAPFMVETLVEDFVVLSVDARQFLDLASLSSDLNVCCSVDTQAGGIMSLCSGIFALAGSDETPRVLVSFLGREQQQQQQHRSEVVLDARLLVMFTNALMALLAGQLDGRVWRPHLETLWRHIASVLSEGKLPDQNILDLMSGLARSSIKRGTEDIIVIGRCVALLLDLPSTVLSILTARQIAILIAPQLAVPAGWAIASACTRLLQRLLTQITPQLDMRLCAIFETVAPGTLSFASLCVDLSIRSSSSGLTGRAGQVDCIKYAVLLAQGFAHIVAMLSDSCTEVKSSALTLLGTATVDSVVHAIQRCCVASQAGEFGDAIQGLVGRSSSFVHTRKDGRELKRRRTDTFAVDTDTIMIRDAALESEIDALDKKRRSAACTAKIALTEALLISGFLGSASLRQRLFLSVVVPWILDVLAEPRSNPDNRTTPCTLALILLLHAISRDHASFVGLLDAIVEMEGRKTDLLDACAVVLEDFTAHNHTRNGNVDHDFVRMIMCIAGESAIRMAGHVCVEKIALKTSSGDKSSRFQTLLQTCLRAPLSQQFSLLVPHVPLFFQAQLLTRAEALTTYKHILPKLVAGLDGDVSSADSSFYPSDDTFSTNSTNVSACRKSLALLVAMVGKLCCVCEGRDLIEVFFPDCYDSMPQVRCLLCDGERSDRSPSKTSQWLTTHKELLFRSEPEVLAPFISSWVRFLRHDFPLSAQVVSDVIERLGILLSHESDLVREAAYNAMHIIGRNGGVDFFLITSISEPDIRDDTQLKWSEVNLLPVHPRSFCEEAWGNFLSTLIRTAGNTSEERRTRILSLRALSRSVLQQSKSASDSRMAALATILTLLVDRDSEVSRAALLELILFDRHLRCGIEPPLNSLAHLLTEERFRAGVYRTLIGAYFPPAAGWPDVLEGELDLRLVAIVCQLFPITAPNIPGEYIAKYYAEVMPEVCALTSGPQREFALGRVTYALGKSAEDMRANEIDIMPRVLVTGYLHLSSLTNDVPALNLFVCRNFEDQDFEDKFWNYVAGEMVPALAFFFGDDRRAGSHRLVDGPGGSSRNTLKFRAQGGLKLLAKGLKIQNDDIVELMRSRFYAIFSSLQLHFRAPPVSVWPACTSDFASDIVNHACLLQSSISEVKAHNRRICALASVCAMLTEMDVVCLQFQPKIIAFLETVGLSFPLLRREVGKLWIVFVRIWKKGTENDRSSDIFSRIAVNMHRLVAYDVSMSARALAREAIPGLLPDSFDTSSFWDPPVEVVQELENLMLGRRSASLCSVPIAYPCYWGAPAALCHELNSVVKLVRNCWEENGIDAFTVLARGILHNSLVVRHCAIHNSIQWITHVLFDDNNGIQRRIESPPAELFIAAICASSKFENAVFAPSLGRVIGLLGALNRTSLPYDGSISLAKHDIVDHDGSISVSTHDTVDRVENRDLVAPCSGGKEISAQKLSYSLVEHYLSRMYEHPDVVNGFKSGSQDRAAMAIQKLMPVPTAALNDSVARRTSRGGPLPQVKLTERTRAIIDPLTAQGDQSYHMTNRSAMKGDGMTKLPFEQWLDDWLLALLPKTGGSNCTCFLACEGVLQYSTALAQVLLPHVILNVLLNSKNTSNAEDVQRHIVEVLESNSRDMRIQTCVCELLEWLRRWLAGVPVNISAAKLPEGAPNITKILNAVPFYALFNAARRNGNHARALWYLEQHMREQMVRKRMELIHDTGDKKFEIAKLDCPTPANLVSSLDPVVDEVIGDNLPMLLHVFGDLNDSESLAGLARLQQGRRPSTLMARVIQAESTGDWVTVHQGHDAAAQARSALQIDDLWDLGGQADGLLDALHHEGLHNAVLAHADRCVSDRSFLSEHASALQIGAAWRMARWEELDLILAASSGTYFDRMYGQLLRGLHQGKTHFFDETMARARTLAVRELAGVQESIILSQPSIVHLHMLADLDIIQSDPKWKYSLPRFDARRRQVEPSFRQLEPILNGLSACCLIKNDVVGAAESLIRLAEAARKDGLGAAASTSVMRAQGLLSHTLDISRLEPTERSQLRCVQIQLVAEQSKLDFKNGRQTQALAQLSSATALLRPDKDSNLETRLYAKLLLLHTRFICEAQVESSIQIKKRYETIQTYRSSGWERLYYDMAVFSDKLLTARLSHIQTRVSEDTSTIDQMALTVIRYYTLAVLNGARRLFHTLPRMLTLWFALGAAAATGDVLNLESVGAVEGMRSPRKGLSSKAALSATARTSTRRNITRNGTYKEIAKLHKSVAAWQWYTALPQLLSRLAHPDGDMSRFLSEILTKVVVAHTEQTTWHILPHLYSEHAERRQAAKLILDTAKKQLANQQERAALCGGLKDLGDNLVKFAQSDTSKIDKRDLGKKLAISSCRNPPMQRAYEELQKCFASRIHVILPLQRYMSAVMPIAPDENLRTYNAFPFDDIPIITGIVDQITVMRSAAKPKKIALKCSNGQEYPMLAKTVDDLRKDARMLQVTAVLNNLLSRDAASRSRSLQLLTYTVIPLDHANGLIEWVESMKPLKSCIDEVWTRITERIFRHYMDRFGRVVEKEEERGASKQTPEELFEESQRAFPPVFGQWQAANFGLDPQSWHSARVDFARSAAVSSMVGFVLGLGDRHGDNIMVHEKTCQIMHIDFDCLFWKGVRVFKVPERVPFRLTQNVRDGFGVTGVEGTFRTTCEVTLRLLRSNWESLRPELESLLHDPLFENIERSHRQQPGADNGGADSLRITEEPARVLSRIQALVRGESSRSLDIMAYWGVKAPLVPAPDVYEAESHERREFVLSVEGQVEQQIQEAMSVSNLSRMFKGWCAML